MAVSAAKKASISRRRKSAAKKAAVTRKRRAAGKKAARRRQQGNAGRAAAESAIRAMAAPWCKAGLDRNWDALLALCTDDVVLAPPGEASVSGSKLRQWLEAYPVMREFNFNFDRIDVSGDLATGVGRGALTVDVNGQEVSATFKFADVFKRGAKGWRYAHVIWNLDTPGA